MTEFRKGMLIRVGNRIARIIDVVGDKVCLYYAIGPVAIKWANKAALTECYPVDEKDPWGPGSRKKRAA